MRRIVIVLMLLLAAATAVWLAAGSRRTAAATTAAALDHATLLRHGTTPEGWSLWTLVNPWDSTAVLHRYVLVPRGASADEHTLQAYAGGGTTVVRVPVRRAGVATAVHCGLLCELGAGGAICGVCEKQYIDIPLVRQGLRDGTVADFGNGMAPNVERIIDVHPDALLLTPFEHSGGYGRVESLGIPIVECAEYMERTPLGRAEWMLFYGELFGKERAARTIFGSVVKAYTALCDTAARATRRPRLLTELMYGGQWFVPSGGSTMACLFRDAAVDYAFARLPGSGSTPLPFETVLAEAGDADLWLVKQGGTTPLTYASLAADYQPYTRFRAYAERHIHVCDLSHTRFYEETPFHPELLLRDIIAIAHPELLGGVRPKYYRPL